MFPVFNGTGANVTALTSVLPRWGAVISTSTAHIHTDEGGAPEKVAGLKLFTVDTPDGKLTPELVATQAWGFDDEHRAQPAAVSITQTTELGTVYTPAEIRAIADAAHEHDMALHLDGARIWNAAAALGVPFREFTTDAGRRRPQLRRHQERAARRRGDRRAESGSRHRPGATAQDPACNWPARCAFTSAQLLALFDGGLGLASAGHANAMATRLRGALDELVAAGQAPGLSFSQPTQANAVFAVLPNAAADRIRERYRFYDWDRAAGQVRWMTRVRHDRGRRRRVRRGDPRGACEVGQAPGVARA